MAIIIAFPIAQLAQGTFSPDPEAPVRLDGGGAVEVQAHLDDLIHDFDRCALIQLTAQNFIALPAVAQLSALIYAPHPQAAVGADGGPDSILCDIRPLYLVQDLSRFTMPPVAPLPQGPIRLQRHRVMSFYCDIGHTVHDFQRGGLTGFVPEIHGIGRPAQQVHRLAAPHPEAPVRGNRSDHVSCDVKSHHIVHRVDGLFATTRCAIAKNPVSILSPGEPLRTVGPNPQGPICPQHGICAAGGVILLYIVDQFHVLARVSVFIQPTEGPKYIVRVDKAVGI